MLIEGEDYTIDNGKIFLSDAITHRGTSVNFHVFRTLTVTPQDYDTLRARNIVRTVPVSMGPVDVTGIPVGQYMMLAGTEQSETSGLIDSADIYFIGASANPESTETSFSVFMEDTGNVTYTPVKENAMDEVFKIQVDSIAASPVIITLIKLF